MSQATLETNPDAAIFEMGHRLAELDREHRKFHEASVQLRRRGQHPESDAANKLMDLISKEQCQLEWKAIYTPAATPEGHEEKLRIVDRMGFSFDRDVIAEIMWMLAYEAGRLGISDTIPQRFKRAFADAAAEAA